MSPKYAFREFLLNTTALKALRKPTDYMPAYVTLKGKD